MEANTTPLQHVTTAGTQPAPDRIEWRDGQWYWIRTVAWSAATGATLRVGDSDEIGMEETQDEDTPRVSSHTRVT